MPHLELSLGKKKKSSTNHLERLVRQWELDVILLLETRVGGDTIDEACRAMAYRLGVY